jgi:hypothetical protein
MAMSFWKFAGTVETRVFPDGRSNVLRPRVSKSFVGIRGGNYVAKADRTLPRGGRDFRLELGLHVLLSLN